MVIILSSLVFALGITAESDGKYNNLQQFIPACMFFDVAMKYSVLILSFLATIRLNAVRTYVQLISINKSIIMISSGFGRVRSVLLYRCKSARCPPVIIVRLP